MKQLLLLLIAGSLLLAPSQADAQHRGGKGPQAKEQTAPGDSTKKHAPKGPVAIEKFFKENSEKMEGMTTVYKQDNKFYLADRKSVV